MTLKLKATDAAFILMMLRFYAFESLNVSKAASRAGWAVSIKNKSL
jgi:hypothetical protein